jgi:NTE family protein
MLAKMKDSPGFALVLGSGGVRSVAALGLVEVLQREGLAPDLIVGCSAGAMFGALVAMGHPAEEAARIAATLWSPEVTRRRRWRAVPQMVLPRLCGFDADFGMRDDGLVMERLQRACGSVRIEDLPLPLRVVATDAATGDTVVLSRGPLVPALRASIALPFLFSPVAIEGRRLIDGFVSDPLPVGAAADAQAILALGFEAALPRRIDGPSRMLGQVTSAMTNNLMQARLAAAQAGGPPMVSLIAKFDRRVGLFDTAAMPYLVGAGRALALQHLDRIRELTSNALGDPARRGAAGVRLRAVAAA